MAMEAAVLAHLRSGAVLEAARIVPSAGSAEHAERTAARLQQVSHGKNTLGYDVYRLRVPRAKRRREDASSPLPANDCSKRNFDEAVRTWRRALHRHFPVGGGGGGAGGQQREEGGGGAEEESVVRLANGRVRARVMPGSHPGTGGALPALLRRVYGGCRREAVGVAAARAAAGRAVWEAEARGAPPLPPLPPLQWRGSAPPTLADLAPGPRGPAAGTLAWDEEAAGVPEALRLAWAGALGSASAAAAPQLTPQQVQDLVGRALALQPTQQKRIK